MIKLKHLISEYEKGGPLVFTHDCRDSYRGQNYCTLYAKDTKENVVGIIQYSTYENKVYVDVIKTKEEERRKGIATLMAKELQREFPNFKIEWGMTTPDGTSFLGSL